MSKPGVDTSVLQNVQGDILRNGFPKKAQIFFFFTITDATAFAENIVKVKIETGEEIRQFRIDMEGAQQEGTLLPAAHTNLALTFRGLAKLSAANQDLGLQSGIDSLKGSAPAFVGGMHQEGEKTVLGDPAFSSPIFNSDAVQSLDGVFLIAGDSIPRLDSKLATLLSIMNPDGTETIKELGTEIGEERWNEPAHEHFGFNDGISHPQVLGLDDQDLEKVDKVKQLFDPSEGKLDKANFVEPGVVLIGRKGDHEGGFPGQSGGTLIDKPAWMLDGSFLVFRKLEQHVGAWNNFLDTNAANPELGLSHDQLGARLMGRWKSGCPLLTNDQVDDPTQALQNDFAYGGLTNSEPPQGFSGKCPFGAHVRKTNIRLPGSEQNGPSIDASSRIMRRGIPYGRDWIKGKEDVGRGLLFAAYQATIEDGYRFIQQSWANSPTFPAEGSGFDVTIGQKQDAASVETSDVGGNTSVSVNGINAFVTPLGGEYFFAPSIQLLKNGFNVSGPVAQP